MQQEIPLIPEPSQEVSIILSNQDCIITIYMRGEYYYFDLVVNDVSLVEGQICSIGVNLIPFSYLGFNGAIFFSDLENGDTLDYKGFGSRFLLIYDDGAT